jgi:RND family efflux transporter MFP subunit
VVYAFRTADVAAEVAGRVVERLVEPGDRVEAGDILVALDAERHQLAVDEARATLRARLVDREEARRELERGDELMARNTISASQHDALRFASDRASSAEALARAALGRAQRALADTQVRAPFAGTVESISVDEGDYAMPGGPIARVADFTRVRVKTGVTAGRAATIEVGADASAAFAALGGRRFEGRVRAIGRIAEGGSGTYPVEVWLEQPDANLREGMVASVRFSGAGEKPTTLVPRAALLRRGGVLSLFAVDESAGDPRAVARPVRVGRSGPHAVELLEGAQVGERVVIDGLFALRDGARVFIDDSAPKAPANTGDARPSESEE